MKAKKLLALLLTGAMAAALGTFAVACNNGENPETGGTGGGGGNADYTIDQTEYYLVGTGAGDLKQNAWSNTNHILKLVRDEEADHNVFTITISMYADDAFQIIHDDSWDGQMGISFMQGAVEDGDKTVVKDADENVIFYGGGDYKSDITLSKGYDAQYTFSLHTFPDGDRDAYITYVKGDDLKPLSDMYVVGDFNDFGFKQAAFENAHMTKNGDIWRYSLEVTDEKYFKYDENGDPGNEYTMIGVMNNVANDNNVKMVYTDASGSYKKALHGNDEYNLVPAGKYTVTYNSADNSVSIRAVTNDIYFIGSMNGWNTDMGDEWKLTENDETGIWSGYLTITEEDYAVDKADDKDVQRDYATVKLYNKLGGASDTWLAPSEGNLDGSGNIMLTAGEYYFTYNPETKEVKYEKCEYYVYGTFVDGDNHIQNFVIVKDLTPVMTESDGKYVATVNVTDVSKVVDGTSDYKWLATEGDNAIFAIKVVYGTVLGGRKADYGIGDNGGNYFFHAEGEYSVTFDPATSEITVAEVVHEVTVTFNLNYAEAAEPEVETITQGTTVTEPTEPTRTDYTFYGWYTEENCENKFDFTKPVNANTELYARWVANSEIPSGTKVTFNYNDGGATPDKDVDIDAKGLVAPEAAERDGYYFLGWYTAQSNGELVNFDELVTEDKTVYAHWNQIKTGKYHIVGAIKDDRIGDWNVEDVDKLVLTHSDKYPTANVFTISIRLFAGDQFKICCDNTWGPFAAGTLRGDSSQLSGSDNIEVKVSGDYVLYANADTNELTWTVEPLANPNDMYFVYDGKEEKLGAGDEAWTGYITVDGTKPLKLIDKYDGNKEYPVGDGNLEAGEYFVKFNVEAKTVQYEKCEYYVYGTFVDGDNHIQNFVIVKDLTPVMTESDGKYVATVNVTDVSKVVDGTSNYGWLATEGDNAIFAIKVVYGTVLGGRKADYGVDGSNYFFHEAGEYTVTFDTSTNTITVTQKTA